MTDPFTIKVVEGKALGDGHVFIKVFIKTAWEIIIRWLSGNYRVVIRTMPCEIPEISDEKKSVTHLNSFLHRENSLLYFHSSVLFSEDLNI